MVCFPDFNISVPDCWDYDGIFFIKVKWVTHFNREQFGCILPWFSCNLTSETPCKVRQQTWALIQFWCHLLLFWMCLSIILTHKLLRINWRGRFLSLPIYNTSAYVRMWMMSLRKFLTFFFLILGCGLEHSSWTKLPCYFCKSKARILVCNSGGYEHGVF